MGKVPTTQVPLPKVIIYIWYIYSTIQKRNICLWSDAIWYALLLYSGSDLYDKLTQHLVCKTWSPGLNVSVRLMQSLYNLTVTVRMVVHLHMFNMRQNYWNTPIFIEQYVFTKCRLQNGAILSRPPCVNTTVDLWWLPCQRSLYEQWPVRKWLRHLHTKCHEGWSL